MVLQPMPDRRPALPNATDEPLNVALPLLLDRRRLTVSELGGLLRAEGIAISRTRLHQLANGSGAPPTAEQLERLASVLGVQPRPLRRVPPLAGAGAPRSRRRRLRPGDGQLQEPSRPPRPAPIADDDGVPGAPRYPAPVTSQSEERE